MTTRREFLIGTGAGIAALGTARLGNAQDLGQRPEPELGLIDKIVHPQGRPLRLPLVVSTWDHGLAANQSAWEILKDGGRALDAVEQGVRVTEADPEVRSVGYGGLPDREGNVTLDSCIMDETGNAGSVAFLQNIMHPISVARKVMEDTPHVMLVGEGARHFAMDNGFPEEDLLTEKSRRTWKEWLKTSEYKPWAPASDPAHDTISMLAIDKQNNLSGSCTTSGLAFKMHGRVGDSPIIGASLFVDNEVGAACATGVGEEVMKTVGSFLIVELMRQGMSPQKACREGIRRIVARNPDWRDVQVGYLAVDRSGRVGAFCIQPGFQFSVMNEQGNLLLDAEHWEG
ncbi:MAG: N(4)-(beta-N-acetylglucosaminyl)-L-asparaginase [Gemmatimonadales bacterium]|nr:N(4)-(beta-N-acetylglucosaminyl)-L-asparaginase [Gemmatimonadales bacterium]